MQLFKKTHVGKTVVPDHNTSAYVYCILQNCHRVIMYDCHRVATQLQLNIYHIISYHIISYHIISYHIISYHIISYHIISYHIISYIISCRIVSYIISYRILSYHISYTKLICCFCIAGTASLTCLVKQVSVLPRRQIYPS